MFLTIRPFGSVLAAVLSLCTLQTLLNIAPNDKVKPIARSQALDWQIDGNVSGLTNLPSKPNRNTEVKHTIIPNSIIVLHTGWDSCITLKKLQYIKNKLGKTIRINSKSGFTVP